ncbi:60S ribosomal protein L35 [Blastocystis sp. subtype 4]|uniref:60S ribosomal protein L35 n=1 Tax=Blastocystis sp. subtype 4 TaxID=944170 RepID=UPI0007115352|nr:60S ribosomal protein L35 [Blastocystis sp. subtype 4]KNB46445.1 60S ribosomal protein L35 [Blastocystis sp. subtype 4]|eukprot:XP_014529888.1 60S ribosomal protein L35 [Blastocystis sp. subtype 4]
MSEIEKYKKELSQLRVAQVTQGAPAKLAQIKVVRKNIARALTVLSHQKRAALKEHFAGAKYLPTDLRVKKTRAMRRALTEKQAAKKTLRQQRKERFYSMKKFALKA